ncbi:MULTISPECIES: acyltransferase [unclassified Pseudomonas]|uniref:acyltransferase family protein n=1 Tax=Pseudomonas TaxID=286 RepID=UPI000D9FB0F1|nr:MULTISPECIES: acyltransferase [unclassified Pseudomonas]PYG78785.1 peptidoglycan/LPS O-acetylase OafA/YrhL [Pseudomonas sp. RV120224-01c]PYG82322.1 peptidoglycan/LPS O-acetylase OafA/YrhL [Pseudomonas sp. RV120224-01b]
MLMFGDVIKGRGRDNNFLIIRLLAATAVVVGHSFALSYLECLSCADPGMQLGLPVPVHSLGVEVFFMVSGFLIAASGERNSAKEFYLARALRIVPGLLVCLFLMAFVLGPIVTSLTLVEYFSQGQVYKYFYSPLLIFKDAQFVLPGVTFTPRFQGVSVNGSLWTIPLEMRMYLVLGALVLVARLCRWPIGGLALAALLVALGLHTLHPAFAEYPFKLVVCFLAGSVFYSFRAVVPHAGWLLFACVALFLLSRGGRFEVFTFALLTIYATFYFAYCPQLRLPSVVQDYSYGIYLYAFPIQQLLAGAMPWAGPYWLMLAAVPVSWVAGYASWVLVEKPALAMRKRFSPAGARQQLA